MSRTDGNGNTSVDVFTVSGVARNGGKIIGYVGFWRSNEKLDAISIEAIERARKVR